MINQNILIVGGAGYLGGCVVDLLLKSEHNIRVYDNLLYEETYMKDVPFIYGDIRDIDKLRMQLDWADVVIWLAALVGDQACAIDKPLAKEVNTDTVEYLRNNFDGRVIFMSSCSVYGVSDDVLNEESSLNPLSHYAYTKIWSEDILRGSNALIFRLGTLFGVGDRFSRIRGDLIVNTLVMNAVAKNRVVVFGGKQYRPLIHVKDVAATICDSIGSIETGIYNISSVNMSILDVAYNIKQHFPKLEINVTDNKFEDNRNYKVSCSKAECDLGFRCSYTIDDGVMELKRILLEKRIKNPYASRYSNYKYLSEMGDIL